MRGFLVSLALFALVATIGLSLYLGPDDIAGCKAPAVTMGDRCERADLIVAISGGDTTARADEAIKLYQEGWAGKVVFSGAALDKTGPSNASVMRQRALDAGVPTGAILIDENSATTGENATGTAALVEPLQSKRLLLVTSAYHQRRASIEFRKAFGSDVTIVNHPVANDKQWSSWWWMTPYGWWLGIGEIIKILLSGAVV